jgi:hypothetical protein
MSALVSVIYWAFVGATAIVLYLGALVIRCLTHL